MENTTMDIRFTVKEYYDILVSMCAALEEDPDNDFALRAFADAAYNLAKANCGHWFPEDLYVEDTLSDNAATTPSEGVVVTSVLEDDSDVVH